MNNKRSNVRTMRPLNDFQVFKGACEKSMKEFGSPVMAHHEARLLVQDDQATQSPGRYGGLRDLQAIFKSHSADHHEFKRNSQ